MWSTIVVKSHVDSPRAAERRVRGTIDFENVLDDEQVFESMALSTATTMRVPAEQG